MKKIILICVFAQIVGTMGYAQSSEIESVKEVITAFSKAGDKNNAEELDKYLDDNFRIVMNRLFGSNEVSVISKSVYLEKIKKKEFGGDQRTLTIENIVINGSTASASVSFKGTKMTFVSLITLIKNEKGMWKLVNDVPIVI